MKGFTMKVYVYDKKTHKRVETITGVTTVYISNGVYVIPTNGIYKQYKQKDYMVSVFGY